MDSLVCYLLLNLMFKLHQSPDGSWCSVELLNLVFINYFPETSSIRVEWSAFKLNRYGMFMFGFEGFSPGSPVFCLIDEYHKLARVF